MVDISPIYLLIKKFTERKRKDKGPLDQALITIAESLDIGYVHVDGIEPILSKFLEKVH